MASALPIFRGYRSYISVATPAMLSLDPLSGGFEVFASASDSASASESESVWVTCLDGL